MGTYNNIGRGNPPNDSILPAKNGVGLIITNAKERGRFLRFAIVGSIGAVVDFSIFNLLISAAGFSAVLASVISFACAVVSNFLLNRYWTYPDSRGKHFSRQLVQFLAVSLVGLGIRTPLFAFLEKLLVRLSQQILPAAFIVTPTTIGHNIALAISILVVMMWNFLVNRYWTYNDVS